MALVHTLSWIAFLAIIPIAFAIAWIKNRSSIQTWCRRVSHPDRWLLYSTLDKDCSNQQIRTELKKIVIQARNVEWAASCMYKSRNPQTGDWIIGLISTNQPINQNLPEPYKFRKLPSSDTIRVSGHPGDDSRNIRNDLQQWAAKRQLTYSPTAYSLTAQSFQCWEWHLENQDTARQRPGVVERAVESIFEMRDILLYPVLFTLISIFMCGTGSPWLFGTGIFTIILMSGACKFAFLHQREDITQESHLQNY